tara:strand:- start:2032 stop:4323 length:2292 start_codon:yes stop_codon:yes gene_type:complete
MYKKLLFVSLLVPFLFFSQEETEELRSILAENGDFLESIDDAQIENRSTGEDTSVDQQETILEIESPIFGFDYIRSIPKSITATSDLPVTNDYLISVGDELRIMLTGGKESIYILEVLMDGSIFFPEIGSINVFGESILDVRKTLESLVQLSYVGTEVSVSLESLAAKKINIIGAVKSPGTYIVSPFSTVISSLAYSGGFEDYASLRNILIKRGKKEIIFDLYDFLIFGSREGDINIQQGDTILIKSTNNFIDISGAVNRPKIYEYISNDKYSDLIDFALGLDKDGNEEEITVTVNNNNRKITKKINKNALVGNQTIEALYIGKNVSIDQKEAFVSGNAVTTGFYSAQNQDMSEFLKNLKFSSEIYPFYVTYESTISGGLMKNFSSFSLSDPDSYSNLKVTNNTKLNFFDREDILNVNKEEEEEEEAISVVETINEDKDIENKEKSLVEKINLNDFISVSLPENSLRIPIKGKISPRQLHLFFGSSTKIDLDKVSVVTKNDSYTDAYEIIFDSEELVAISMPSESENLIEVEVQGEIVNPGKYLVSSSTTLLDLYILGGGLRDNAFENGIQLLREEVKEKQINAIREAKSILTDSIIQKSNNVSDRGMVDIESIIKLADLVEPTGRVAGQFNQNSETTKNFTLKDGDLIVIPSLSYEVIVQGEVLNSSSFIYDESLSFKDYIEAAGGFSEYADKRAVFIIKANGLSASSGNNIFSGQVNIEPGDTIVVPRNLDQLELIPSIAMATKIIADLAFSAASLNAIQN